MLFVKQRKTKGYHDYAIYVWWNIGILYWIFIILQAHTSGCGTQRRRKPMQVKFFKGWQGTNNWQVRTLNKL
jgi:hypothetical protein